MPLIKKIIKSFLYRYGYEISRYDPVRDVPFNLLAFVLKDIIIKTPDFFFVQVGANDGKMGDPLFDMIKKYQLKGILIEPLPEEFELLCKNYNDQNQLAFENCAISEKTGKRALYRFTKNPEIPDWAFGMASFNKSHLLKFKDLLKFKHLIEKINVPTLNFNDLYKKYKIDKIDFLQIDTEGYDYNVIKMLFSSKNRPFVINFEHEHLSFEDNMACKQLLIDNNYKFITFGRDILALRDL